MADEDPYISPLKPAVPLPPINQNPNKFYVNFMYKATVVAVFVLFLPFLPSQAPEFINQTLHTRSWEFLQILFVGIAVSYGLFSRKNDETEKDHSSKVDNAHTYVSRFLEVSSVFEDEPVEDSKVQTWNSQYHREKPTVMVAQESSLVDEWTRIRSGANEKPLLLPVRSLKSRVSDSDFALEAKELSDSLTRSSSFTTSSRPSNSSFGGYNGQNLEENVVLRSPIPWRSRSGRMEMKEEIDGIPPYSLPSPMVDSSFRPFESNTYGPQDGPYGPQSDRSPRPNSTPRTPKKKAPSPSQSPPKLKKSPSPSQSPSKLSPHPNLSAKNAATEAARRNTYYKTTPPPPPPPPPPRSGRMEMKEEIDGIPPYSLPSPMAESSFRPFESNTYGPYGPQNARSRGPDSTPKKKSHSPSQSPTKLSPPPTLSAELQPKNAAERARRNTYYQTTPPPPPPPPPPPQSLYAHKPPLVKSNSTLSGSEFSSAKELKRTIRSVPSYPIEPELVLERASSGSGPKKRVGSDGSLAEKSVRTVESVGSDGSLAGKSVRTVGRVEASYPHMSEAAFRGYEKEFDETMSEESEDEADEDVVKEEASSPTSGGEDVNQKADEFIAKFREQIRLQRIESIKRSTAQIARRNSSR